MPSTVLFVGSNAVHDPCQISLAGGDSCPGFCQWQRLGTLGVVIDFRNIRRMGSGLRPLAEPQFDLSRFNEESESAMGRWISDCWDIESEQLQKEMENLMNLQHPCIVCPIGFVLP
jgi:hypothetical protein